MYEVYALAYDAMQHSLATAEPDPRLEQYVDGEALEEILGAVAGMAAEDIVSRSPDTQVIWVRVSGTTESFARVEACHVLGGQSGDYSSSTGEPVELLDVDERTLLYTAEIALDGPANRVTRVDAEESSPPCDESPS
ncbi:hypothetical protein FTX61_07675 [Nitriliruptoraceae bacterium ZYF776]|nr:hypothetical protein [Profundirhabdus halotolerans]